MKCFNHKENDAVGVCKSCSKGICKNCLVDLGHSITCKKTCVTYAEQVDTLIHQNIKMSRHGYKNVVVFFLLFVGVLVLAGGLYRENSINAEVVLGSFFIMLGVIQYFISRKIIKNLYKKTQEK